MQPVPSKLFMKSRFWPTCVDFIWVDFADFKINTSTEHENNSASFVPLPDTTQKRHKVLPYPVHFACFASITHALLNFRISHLGILSSAFHSRSLVLSLVSLTVLFSPPVPRFCCSVGRCFLSQILSSILGLLKLHYRQSFLLAHLTNCQLQVEQPLIWLITCYKGDSSPA